LKCQKVQVNIHKKIESTLVGTNSGVEQDSSSNDDGADMDWGEDGEDNDEDEK
jgi:hypothetical protein